MAPKRVNYFTHQFLREQDFKDEQQYHLEGRRQHNRLFHPPGVLEGFEVRQKGETEITVEPGFAVDASGREIELSQPVTRSLTSFNHDTDAFISVSFLEEFKDEDHVSAGGVEGYVRTTELAEVHEQRREHIPPDAVVLARVKVGSRGHIEHIDMSAAVRKMARQAASGSSGWLRVPFRPARISSVVPGQTDNEFSIDETNAYCGKNGARGSMHIPVPPGASRVAGFKVAGSTRGKITARLFCTGWNVTENAGENTQLKEEVMEDEAFHREVEVDAPIDDTHALTVSIRANNQSEIWLLAVRFE